MIFKGGQKQRIAIARAILKNPQILILDEATSALDRKNEAEIQSTLKELSEGRTTLVIAHRLSTIIDSDRILVLASGELIQEGTHEELINQEGKYQALQKNQLLNEEKNLRNNENIEDIGEKSENKSKNLSRKDEILSKRKSAIEVEKYKKKLQNKYTDSDIIKRLFNNIKDKKFTFGFYLFFGIGSGIIFPIFSILLTDMIDLLSYAFDSDYHHDRNVLILKFLLVCIFSLILKFISVSLSNYFEILLSTRLRVQIYKKLLSLHAGWHDKPENTPGALNAKMASDVLLANKILSDCFIIVLECVTALFVGILISFITSWRIAYPALFFVPLMTLIGKANSSMVRSYAEQTGEVYTNSSGLITESLCNMKTVASFCREDALVDMYEEKMDQPKKVMIRKGNTSGLLIGANQLVQMFYYGIAFFVGIYNLDHDHVSFKDMFLAIFALMFGAFGVGIASQRMPDLGKAFHASRELFVILDDEEKVLNNPQEPALSKKIEDIKGDIEFRDVSFSYPTRDQNVFENFNVKIPGQQKIAFVGPSGCGKSTIFQLILRFYDVDQGEVLLDGINIKKYDINFLRSCFGFVSQEPVLFIGTIEENIKLILFSLKYLNLFLKDTIKKMPLKKK